MSWEARTVLTCRGLNQRGNASEDLVETSASDAEFCANLLLFISDMVQANTMGNASIESVPDVLRHLRHGIGWDICLQQRVSLAVPRWKRVTLSNKGDDPRTDQLRKGADSELPGLATQRERGLTATT